MSLGLEIKLKGNFIRKRFVLNLFGQFRRKILSLFIYIIEIEKGLGFLYACKNSKKLYQICPKNIAKIQFENWYGSGLKPSNFVLD